MGSRSRDDFQDSLVWKVQRNALNNGIAGLIHKSAQETKDLIDKMGMTKFVEKLVESTNMVVAIEWLQNTELMASSKFAVLTASMGFGALLGSRSHDLYRVARYLAAY